jgi:tRNA(Ile)-lysidine synthetase-like protein
MIEKPKSGEIHLPKGVTVVKESGIVYIKPREGFDGQIQELVNVGKPDVVMPMANTREPVSEVGTDAKKQVQAEQFRFYYPVVGEGSYLLPDGSTVTCRILNDFSLSDVPDDTYRKWMDYGKMTGELCLRTRKSGDYLVINKKGNEGNLKNYMINEKIPKSEREEIPLLASGSKIYWVLGYRISEDVKVTADTTTVIEFIYDRKDNESEDQVEGPEGADNG